MSAKEKFYNSQILDKLKINEENSIIRKFLMKK